MKKLFSVLFGLCFATLSFAEANEEAGNSKRTPEELDKLLAPIALYPDSLVALILPASTASADLVLAARFLANNGSSDQIDKQSWDESVKGLARYPELLDWMDENLEWTRELGAAFVAQPADVMNAVQRLRTNARAAGLLKDTPQQRVVVRDNRILILPAEENVIYIPSYDPQVLYVRDYYYTHPSALSFSIGFAVGSWLSYDCDWNRHRVWMYHRPPPSWVYRPDWRHHHHYVDRDCVEWRPNPHFWTHSRISRRFGDRPVPVIAAPHFRGHGPDRNWSHYHHRDARTQTSPLVRREPSRDNNRGRYDRSNRESRQDQASPRTPSNGSGRRDYRRDNNVTAAPPASVNPVPDAPAPGTVVRSSRIPHRVPAQQSEAQNTMSDRRERHQTRSYSAPPSAPPPSAPPPSSSGSTRITRSESRSFTPHREATRHESAPPPPPPAPAPSSSSSSSSSGSSSSSSSASQPTYERSGRFGGGQLR